MKLLLVRHGESVGNNEGRVQGWFDSPLSELGREQARALARRLTAGRWPIDAIYASDLLRAAETAAIAGAALGLPVVHDPRLREYHIGVLTGVVWREVETLYPDIWRAWDAGERGVAVPEEEGRAAFYERTGAALADIRARHNSTAGDRAVVIVSHGGSLRMMLAQLLDLDPARDAPFRFDNTALTVVEFWRCRASIALHNDTCHLDVERS